MKTTIEQAAATKINQSGGPEKVTYSDREVIAADLSAIYGCTDISGCGDTQYAIADMSETQKDEVAHTIACLYMKEQGYDADPEMTYDDICDRLGVHAEGVYTEVFCFIAYEVAEERHQI
jgi:hypothetical protein